MTWISNSSKNLKSHCVSGIIYQFERKRCQRERTYVNFYKSFCCTWTASCQKFNQLSWYVIMQVIFVYVCNYLVNNPLQLVSSTTITLHNHQGTEDHFKILASWETFPRVFRLVYNRVSFFKKSIDIGINSTHIKFNSLQI